MEECTHKLTLNDRRDLVLSGVTEVDSSEDHKILLKTVLGNMEVSGEDLRILNLDLTKGDAVIGGKIAISLQFPIGCEWGTCSWSMATRTISGAWSAAA